MRTSLLAASLVVVIIGPLVALPMTAVEIRFTPPADARVINVREHGAKGDGIADDTASIRAAIAAAFARDNRYAAPPFVWFPDGTYRVSDVIEARAGTSGWSSGWLAGCILIGESRAGSVIKLDDGAVGYGEPATPKWVIATGSEADGDNPGGGGNRAFRHAVINLTIDVGMRNPGATGIDFVASNRGTIENVLIRAGTGSGWCGLCLDRWWPGPALVKDVAIEGFAFGVRMAGHWQYSMTFEGLDLRDQREVGLWTEHNPAFIRKLTSVNAVPAVKVDADDGMIVLIEADLSGAGAGAAIACRGNAYLREVISRGYPVVVDDLRGDADVMGQAGPVTIAEHRLGAQGADSGDATALKLKIEETPRFDAASARDWVNGAADLQGAIDSGAPVVYLPQGSYDVERTIIVRGSVRKIMGMQSSLKAKPGVEPMIRIEGGGEPVVFEHLWFDGAIDHAGDRAIALRHCDLLAHPGLRGSGRGKTFIEDVIGNYEIGPGHRLWARQTNAEFGEVPLLVNRGGTMWILGFKTEGEMTCIENIGGDVELLGGLFYPLAEVPAGRPCLIADGGRMSATWVYNSKHYPIHIRHRAKAGTGGWIDATGSVGRGPALWSVGVRPATK